MPTCTVHPQQVSLIPASPERSLLSLFIRLVRAPLHSRLSSLCLPPMAASSKPADESSHPYDALPNDQDFGWMISDAKFSVDTRTNFYDRSLTSRRYALVGMACSGIFGCSCIVASIITLANQGVFGREILALALDLIVTLCTESIGFVHGISLRSALASESRLHFNTNLRLLTAARGWYNPNGALLNVILAVLLIISYSSVSFIVCLNTRSSDLSESVAIVGLPLLILGIALLLQVMIALSAMRAVKILTWSSSPFDLTAALVHHTQLSPVTLRCMRCVSNLDTFGGPAKPSEIQPSAWHAHPSIRKVVIFLWVIVAACAGWAALVMYMWNNYSEEWGGLSSNGIQYPIPGVDLEVWILLYVNMAAIQGPLTLGLHCSELIANVIRDERQWRYASTRKKGLTTATNPVKMISSHPICLILFVAKPFLHWMFGLAINLGTESTVHPIRPDYLISPDYLTGTDNTVGTSSAVDGQLAGLGVSMFTAQVWNLCIALFIFACFFTFVALRRPRGPQPAAYGHLQTLANLVDEWSPVMWWGHKEDGIPYCHAGTSDHPLPKVKMDCVYAGSGSGSGSLVPLS
ncbi:uncharacterized protein BJ212DRAFT_1483797 [Suillus subaureus]|uniref:Uncharacterized protein n=1 Tax=Suillus subaureus TaxID=48587 RepID=A0A9P7JA57_9AGAM|nr:uncharacterized protein BJ212DRAFT_1483797 [Suillus subaureus]KAG1811126.1 hypothetical protein BJ212DRAFT_1483797 [Suillus subaureus]